MNRASASDNYPAGGGRDMAWRSIFVLASIMATSAAAVDATPIDYRVIGNNRLFMAGQDARFIHDLHLYMRCTNGRLDSPSDIGKECAKYRSTAKVGNVLVPNLRTGAVFDEFKVHYDKKAGAYPVGYATSSRRTLELNVDDGWIASAGGPPTVCRWEIGAEAGRTINISSATCAPLYHTVDLSLSADATRFEYRAPVKLTLTTAQGKAKTFVGELEVRDVLIVAMGDSFTSGEGNPEHNYRAGVTPAQWLDYRCHRSVFSYPVIVSTALALADPRHSVTLVHVACSGAQTTKGLQSPYEGALDQQSARALWRTVAASIPSGWNQYGSATELLDPQITQVKRLLEFEDGRALRRRPDILLMSVGVNDVSLVGLLNMLATKNCTESCIAHLRRLRTTQRLDCGNRDTTLSDEDRLGRSFDCLKKMLGNLDLVITKEMAPQRTYLMQYINPLHDEDGKVCSSNNPKHKQLLRGVLKNYGSFGRLCDSAGRLCPFNPTLTAGEIEYAYKEFLIPLQDALQAAADKNHWTVPLLRDAEKKRGFCASRSWYHRFDESMARQHLNPGSRRNSVGTLHPNTFGQYFVAVRAMSSMIRDRHFDGWHNFGSMKGDRFGHASRGFAWQVWQMNTEPQNIRCHYWFKDTTPPDCEPR